MLRVPLLVVLLLVALPACPPPSNRCTEASCPSGEVCNQVNGLCEPMAQGGGSGGTGGGSTGGGGGRTGGGTGGGAQDSGMDGGGDAGMDGGSGVDPFDDGGVFVPGDICGRAIPVVFDRPFDGGLMARLSVDLSAAGDQYRAVCNFVPAVDPDGGTPPPPGTRDLLFAVTLTQPKGLIVSALDTSDAGRGQDAVLALVTSPCPRSVQAACVDTTQDPEELTMKRLPPGTYYVLLENYATGQADSTFEVTFKLVDPVPGPAHDVCAGAQALVFNGDTATVNGTTAGAFNDSAGSPMSCSRFSQLNPEVYYSLTLTQPQDVEVSVQGAPGSTLLPVIALTNQCGPVIPMEQRGCSASIFTAHNVPPGTYYIVVDGDNEPRDQMTGAFTLTAKLLPPIQIAANDTCAAPATLVPNVTQMVDVNKANKDYTLSCTPQTRGGDVVYQFTTTAPQRVTLTAASITADGGVDGDAVISLRRAPCDQDTNQVACVDDRGLGTEALLVPNLPAGTYYVVLTSWSETVGSFAVRLTVDPVRVPPSNDTCASPDVVMLTGGMATRTVDLADARADIPSDLCAAVANGADVVYEVTIPPMQTLTVVATPVPPIVGMVLLDTVLFAKVGCGGAVSEVCVDNGGPGPEILTVPNPSASPKTVFVVAKAFVLQQPGELNLTFTAM